jgi:hypothetical protein
MSQDPTKPPLQPVDALIVSVIGDYCELDLGEHGRGRLRQSDSRARNERAPLEELAPYAKGRRLRVILHARHRETATNPYWFVNERWADDNPWPNLEAGLARGVMDDAMAAAYVLRKRESESLGARCRGPYHLGRLRRRRLLAVRGENRHGFAGRGPASPSFSVG